MSQQLPATPFAHFVGLDWAKEEHAVCVLDSEGKALWRCSVPHAADGLTRFLKKLAAIALPAKMPVAIERPSGLLVDTLRQAGHPVFCIHPHAVQGYRLRYRVNAAKDDRGDAYLLADVLRTDWQRLKVIRPHSDAIKGLSALVHGRDALVKQRIQLSNQLHAILESFFPGASKLFAKLASPIALAFLERFPCPSEAAGLDLDGMRAFCRSQRYSGGKTPEELLKRLQRAAKGLAGKIEEQGKREVVLGYVALLRSLLAAIKRLEAQIEELVVTIPAIQPILSLPRIGKINAAQLIAEIGEDPARFASFEHLTSIAGVVPVTRASGKSRAVVYRFGCNKRLRKALATWADNSRKESSWAQAVYERLRAEGKEHAHAIRILARAWLRVLWQCWKNGEAYDKTRHGQAAAIAECEAAQTEQATPAATAQRE